MADERRVAEIVGRAWCGLLEVDSAATDDDFFELGGNSMLAITLVTRLEEELGIAFPLEVLFVDGTYGSLVTACAAATTSTGGGANSGANGGANNSANSSTSAVGGSS